jgi:kynurenine formamidase
MPQRPAYRDLPEGCAWGVFEDDASGALALLTPERVLAAAKLVRTGRRFSLDLMIDQPDPPFFGREAVKHEVFQYSTNVIDDRLDSFFPQGSTQWDALAHYAHPKKGFHGGHDADAIMNNGALGIEAWHSKGIVGRGVLLDMARHTEIPGDDSFVVTPDLLDECADAQDVSVREGDILCVRVGWLSWYRSLDPAARVALAESSRGQQLSMRIPGIGPGPEVAEWLWDHGVAAIAVDNPTVEPIPFAGSEDGSLGPEDALHARVLALLGIPLGEFFDLDALAEDCAADGVYDFFFTSAPLGIPGGIGSPPNALAIK